VLRILGSGPIEAAGFPILLEAAAAAEAPDLGVELVVRWRRQQPQARAPEHLLPWLEAGLRRQEDWLRGR
jgi:hypothetical protein